MPDVNASDDSADLRQTSTEGTTGTQAADPETFALPVYYLADSCEVPDGGVDLQSDSSACLHSASARPW